MQSYNPTKGLCTRDEQPIRTINDAKIRMVKIPIITKGQNTMGDSSVFSCQILKVKRWFLKATQEAPKQLKDFSERALQIDNEIATNELIPIFHIVFACRASICRFFALVVDLSHVKYSHEALPKQNMKP